MLDNAPSDDGEKRTRCRSWAAGDQSSACMHIFDEWHARSSPTKRCERSESAPRASSTQLLGSPKRGRQAEESGRCYRRHCRQGDIQAPGPSVHEDRMSGNSLGSLCNLQSCSHPTPRRPGLLRDREACYRSKATEESHHPFNRQQTDKSPPAMLFRRLASTAAASAASSSRINSTRKIVLVGTGFLGTSISSNLS